MSEPYVGQITLFGGNFAPRGWAFCQGQIMSIAQNQQLFAILGTTYGGNGSTTFALPDLRGRAPIGTGTGPLGTTVEGEMSGANQVTLLQTNMAPTAVVLNNAQAQVSVPVAAAVGDVQIPTNATILATANETSGSGAVVNVYSSEPQTTTLRPFTAPVTGSGFTQGGQQPVNIRNPYLGINYIIAVSGIFPSRN